ncbi:nuclear transport factor 2 family protein [Shewanella putrefaciens]|uniref:Nuclear transport factor 2 family protein n=1 Tax=Shewanella putrefaciens TaxID=24 RepID=A0ABX8X9X1_SHEPU|nr:nuclear transport factor 2 family protein [Shewanella putrefaciens]AVV85763.1 ketosteroid isomerase [Shewanella putrefaciens]MCT8944708.1 nuclear transport factor 2 family protein [Shewanella putrefaciens]QSE48460.1 nuclear transport factor 2 family protein [Shewanella putrefaciens]QYX71865.1 nuclear transport factor 2 family protein [Shewanella putrefaciens]GGN24813.1 ketosteroid isomerase [Shewanella putrefaciens]
MNNPDTDITTQTERHMIEKQDSQAHLTTEAILLKQTEDNLAIVKSTYEGQNSAENARNLKQALAEDARWTEAVGFPYAGTYIGFSDIANNVFDRLGSEWDNYRVIIEDYVAQGNKVFAYGTYSGRYVKTGKTFSARVAHLWQLHQGKIISFEQFVDSQSVINAMQ